MDVCFSTFCILLNVTFLYLICFAGGSYVAGRHSVNLCLHFLMYKNFYGFVYLLTIY